MLKEQLEGLINKALILTDYSPNHKPNRLQREKLTTIIKLCYEVAEANRLKLFESAAVNYSA